MLIHKLFDIIVVYKISNLMMVARIEEMGAHSLKPVLGAKNLTELSSVLQEKSKALIVCDLTIVKEDLPELEKIARTRDSEVLGYYPHIDKGAERAGRSCGIKYVVPRSAMESRIRQLMK
jgi:hypothetical protein